jgi:ABC-type transport system involved in multi-copper enzyme maturation permease subunit
MNNKLIDHIRIVWSITFKDLLDAVKNKNILSIILTALFVVIVYKYLPGYFQEEGPPKLLVYDPGSSILLNELYDSPTVDLYVYDSEVDMKYYLTNGEEPELGLVIPNGLDAPQNSNQTLELQGYALHIFKEKEVADLTQFIEAEIEYLLDHPVHITVEKIQMQPETYGLTVLTSMGFVFTTIMVGMLMVPHMMIEEKQTKTIDVLRISPAGSGHIVMAKAITGLTYTLLMLIIAVGFNWVLIQQRWLFLLGGLTGSLFAISLGMFLGLLIDSRQQLTLWAWVGFIPLLFPMMLSLMDDILPPTIIQIFRWIPTSSLLRIFRTSMAGTAPWKYYGPQFIPIVICAILFLLIDFRLVRRMDRKY